MKKILLLLSLGIFSLYLAPQAKADKREIKKELKVALTPKTLTLIEKNGVVNAKFLISVPSHYVKSNKQYIFTPVLTDLTNVYALPCVIIEGERYTKMAAKNGHSKHMKEKWECAPDMSDAIRLQATKNGRTINYEADIPFAEWMADAKMVTIQRFNSKRETVLIAEDIYASKVIITPKPKIFTETIRKVHYLEGDIKVNFQIGSSKLDTTLDENTKELDDLNMMIKGIMDQPNAKIDSICIIASSSPDGSYELNKRLAAARAETVKNYITNNFADCAEFEDRVKTEYIAENWRGLDRYIMRSNISNKEQAIKAISIKNLEEREKAMISLPQYDYIKKYLLPKLRFVKYQIYFHTVTVEEIIVMPKQAVSQQPKGGKQRMTQRPQSSSNYYMPQKDREKDKFKRRKMKIKDKNKILPRYIRYNR